MDHVSPMESAVADSNPNPEEAIEESLTDWVSAGSYGEQRAEAKGEILRCLRNREETLNLARRGLKELPKEVGLLTHLKTLDVSENDLETFPSSILNIKGLQTLNLNAMQRPLSLELMHYVEKLLSPDSHMNFQGTKVSLELFIDLSEGSFWNNILFEDCPFPVGDKQKAWQAFKDSLPEDVIQFAIEPHPEELGNYEGINYMDALLEWAELIRKTPAFQSGGETRKKLIEAFSEHLQDAREELAHRRVCVNFIECEQWIVEPNGEIPLPDGFPEAYVKETSIILGMREGLTSWAAENDLEREARQQLKTEIMIAFREDGRYLEIGHITSLPPEIGRLSSLYVLNLNEANLSSLPEEIKGLQSLQTLALTNNVNLTHVPDGLFELPRDCRILLEGSGLAEGEGLQRIVDAMPDEGYEGPQFFLEDPALVDDVPPMRYERVEAVDEENFRANAVRNAIAELCEAVGYEPTIVVSDALLKGGRAEKLLSWMSRLSRVAGLDQGGEEQKRLIKDILKYIDLANTKKASREAFFQVIEDAATTCGDRMALSVIHLDIQHTLATMDRSDLNQFADFLKRGVWAMDLLEDVARHKIANVATEIEKERAEKIREIESSEDLEDVEKAKSIQEINEDYDEKIELIEEIEIYLGFPMMLKGEFDLPFNLDEMLYFGSSKITDEELAAAREFVLSQINNEEAFHAFLIKNDHWRATLKERFPEEMEAIEAQREDLIDAERYDEVDQLYIDLTKQELGS